MKLQTSNSWTQRRSRIKDARDPDSQCSGNKQPGNTSATLIFQGRLHLWGVWQLPLLRQIQTFIRL